VILALRPRVVTSGEEAVFESFEREGVTFALPERFLSRLERLSARKGAEAVGLGFESTARLIAPSVDVE
jgi:hypothetical protein